MALRAPRNTQVNATPAQQQSSHNRSETNTRFPTNQALLVGILDPNAESRKAWDMLTLLMLVLCAIITCVCLVYFSVQR